MTPEERLVGAVALGAELVEDYERRLIDCECAVDKERASRNAWADRAERAEAEVARLRDALEAIRAKASTYAGSGAAFAIDSLARAALLETENPAGEPCRSCGSSVAACDQHIKDQGRGCCGACYVTDTHALLRSRDG